ncbi:hypothetical protein [uncultured Flavobacterium sp.]|uniref:hypothetical protein n=1 Tax=uncultured Flavobacterium sp. TaxID=165435 RepID=UPI0029304A04|nr:hypothetical protein [uncultured Flavobacterium sp.]
MNKSLKYLISLFLAFVVIANDGTLVSQSKSADYYQSSFVILRRELDFSSSQLYKFVQSTSRTKTIFSIVFNYLNLEDIFSFQIKTVLKLRKLLYQNLTSFIKQSVFVNEIITSGNFNKSLYIA